VTGDVTELVEAVRWITASPEDAPTRLDVGLALLLGAVQGIAEFLPISSSGHLALANAYLGVDPAAGGHTFAIAVHAGTLLSVLVVYRSALGDLIRGLASRDLAAQRLLLALVVGSLPLGVMLVRPLREAVIRLEGDVRAVACLLLVTATLLAVGELHRRRAARPALPGQAARADRHLPPDAEPRPAPPGAPARGRPSEVTSRAAVPSWPQALAIGAFQLVAVLPGVSRAGSTITGGLVVGLDDEDAARFSFLLSIPAVTAATGLEVVSLLKDAHGPSGGVPLTALGAGFIAAFAVGALALTSLLALLRRAGLGVFIPYLVLVATLALLFPPAG
jgi:undecaprenyl-diphosphatase